MLTESEGCLNFNARVLLQVRTVSVHYILMIISLYLATQRSWFARVNALCNLCNLSRKKSREVAAISGPISE